MKMLRAYAPAILRVTRVSIMLDLKICLMIIRK